MHTQMELTPHEPRQISRANVALEFMLAGDAYFTLRSQATQTRYTYHVRKSEDGRVHFVSFLTGPENTHNYTYLGVIRNGWFELTKKSRLPGDSAPVKAFNWTLQNLRKGIFPDRLEFWHEGKCGRCGRKLTVPESIAFGIGPECRERMAS